MRFGGVMMCGVAMLLIALAMPSLGCIQEFGYCNATLGCCQPYACYSRDPGISPVGNCYYHETVEFHACDSGCENCKMLSFVPANTCLGADDSSAMYLCDDAAKVVTLQSWSSSGICENNYNQQQNYTAYHCSQTEIGYGFYRCKNVTEEHITAQTKYAHIINTEMPVHGKEKN